jgi:Glycosyl hydrolases family 18
VRRLFTTLAAVALPAGLLTGLLTGPPAGAATSIPAMTASASTASATDVRPAAAANWPYVSPYVDMGAWPTPVLSQMSQASGLRGFTLGFVTGAGCKASWFNAYDPRTAWQKDEIAKLRSAGGDVKISFGGASGIELAQACTSVDTLYKEYAAVVDAYGAKYADFDIEGAATADPASIARRSQALARLKQTHPNLKISLTLPVLPEGLTGDGLNLVRSAKNAGAGPDAVNVMAMDYYRSGTDDGDAATRAAQSTHDQLKAIYTGRSDAQIWAMVGVTPMLGQNDDHSVYDQNDARQLVSFARQHHVGGLGFWEETRDRNACTGALYQCTNISQQPYEFSKIFAQYTG